MKLFTALPVLLLAGQAAAQAVTVRIMPLGASIVTVSSSSPISQPTIP